MFLENYKTLQAELAITKSALAAKTSECESLRSSSALTTPLSATPTSVVSRNPFHAHSSMAPPPTSFSERLVDQGFEMVGVVSHSPSRRGGDSPVYEDGDEEVVPIGGKSKREAKGRAVSSSVAAQTFSSGTGSRYLMHKDKSVAAPAPMTADAHPIRNKRVSPWKCICPCGDLTYVMGTDYATETLERHRKKCHQEYDAEHRDDDFARMGFRNKDKIAIIRTYEVREMSDEERAKIVRSGRQLS
jgi:hypothetical protein